MKKMPNEGLEERIQKATIKQEEIQKEKLKEKGIDADSIFYNRIFGLEAQDFLNLAAHYSKKKYYHWLTEKMSEDNRKSQIVCCEIQDEEGVEKESFYNLFVKIFADMEDV